MTRKEQQFTWWCEAATAGIRYKPDRKAVAKELMDHLEDAYEAALSNGLSGQEAEQKALDSMGSAYEIAPQLAVIYNPFWGYFLRVCKILLIALLVLGIIPIWNYAKDLDLQDKPSAPFDFEIYEEASYGGDTGRTLLHLSQPDASFSSDANTFTVTDVVVFTETLEDGTQSSPRLFLLLRQTSLLPWSEQRQYFQFFQITGWCFLRDDLGNVYNGYNISDPDGGSIYTNGAQSGIFRYTHQCGIYNFPTEAKWVELCYERDGRSFSVRIDLTGGAAA